MWRSDGTETKKVRHGTERAGTRTGLGIGAGNAAPHRLEPVPGNSLTLEYRVVKLLDLEGRAAEILARHELAEHDLAKHELWRAGQLNIFAAVVDLHLRIQRERKAGNFGDDQYRFKLKTVC